MVDTGVVGCSWIELPPKTWKIRVKGGNQNVQLISRCQIEVDVAWNQFIAHAPEGEWSKVAPFRYVLIYKAQINNLWFVVINFF